MEGMSSAGRYILRCADGARNCFVRVVGVSLVGDRCGSVVVVNDKNKGLVGCRRFEKEALGNLMVWAELACWETEVLLSGGSRTKIIGVVL